MTPRIMKVIKGTLSVGFGSLVDGGTMYKVLGASLTVLTVSFSVATCHMLPD
jgi:hypothetical protein